MKDLSIEEHFDDPSVSENPSEEADSMENLIANSEEIVRNQLNSTDRKEEIMAIQFLNHLNKGESRMEEAVKYLRKRVKGFGDIRPKKGGRVSEKEKELLSRLKKEMVKEIEVRVLRAQERSKATLRKIKVALGKN